MGGNDRDLGWRPIMIFAAIALGAFVLHQAWPNWADYCPSNEEAAACARHWVGALSGWAAAAAAAVTIVVLVRQTTQAAKFRADDRMAKAQSVMEIVALDLMATANRLRVMNSDGDRGPHLSQTASGMIAEVVSINPLLSVMIQRHSLEATRIDNAIREARPTDPLGLSSHWTGVPRPELLAVAFRAAVLANVFAECSSQMKQNGKIASISPGDAAIDGACEKFGASREHLTYLKALIG